MKTSGQFAALAFLLVTLTGCDDTPSPAAHPSPATDVTAARRAQKPIDVTAINKAAEKFYVQEGRFPTNLTELVWKDYLPMIPVLPEGMSWDYDTNSGTVMISKEAVKE